MRAQINHLASQSQPDFKLNRAWAYRCPELRLLAFPPRAAAVTTPLSKVQSSFDGCVGDEGGICFRPKRVLMVCLCWRIG